MKALLLALALLPSLSFAAPNNDGVADRVDQSRERTEDRFERNDQRRQQHGIGFVCEARDAEGRVFQSPWMAADLDGAKRSVLNRCGLFWNKGCRLIRCGKQRF